MITVLDLGICNIASVIGAFQRIGVDTCRAEDASGVRSPTALVLPGVGSFSDGMACLAERGLLQPISEAVANKIPVLGICLGMQLFAEESEEHRITKGLGFIQGSVLRLRPKEAGERVPNIGWCDVEPCSGARLFSVKSPEKAFYFVHSYFFQCNDQLDVAATIHFGGNKITAAIQKDNLFGVQFHPEKSQNSGLQLLHNFVQFVYARR